ncbi:hypothetical protein JXA88_03785 [Candidatus Fermentibacteria bacterium]|nr:hypothetical protein [Candidatus Fermentibacteria bacterium]
MTRIALVWVLLPSVIASQPFDMASPVDSLNATTQMPAAATADFPSDTLAPNPVESLVVLDAPNDAGGVIDLFWTPSLDEGLGKATVGGYEVLRAESPEGPFLSLVTLGPGTDRFRDRTAFRGTPYYYVVRTNSQSGSHSDSRVSQAALSKSQWLDTNRLSVMGGIMVILLVLLVTRRLPDEQEWLLPAARTLTEILSRRHQGPTVYIPGTAGFGDMGTIASLTLLEQVLRLGERETGDPIVYTSDPMAHALASELLPRHTPDFLSPDPLIFSLSFTGEALRQRPGVGVVVGGMGAEAFLLSEALSRSGGVAVAGTTDIGETPFLVATCDLTLIGEEILLAGPVLAPGGCRAAGLVQDRLKLLVWILILVGVAAAKLGVSWYVRLFSTGGE